MERLTDLYAFLAVPILIIVFAMITVRGSDPKRYKIVCETNILGEERYEVWLEYPAFPLVRDTWRLEEKFDTLDLAYDYLARRVTKTRATIKEGTF
jgi:hypothetical protein